MDFTAQLNLLASRQEQEIKQLQQSLKQANHNVARSQAALSGLQKDIGRLQTFLSLSNDIFFVVNESGLVREVSSSLTRQLGYLEREINGHKLSEIVHPGDWDLLEDTLKNSTNQPREVLPALEIRFKRRDDEWRYFEMVTTNLRDDRQMGGIVLCATDITDRKQLEDKLALTRQFLLDFDEELRPLTLESAVWETAIHRLEATFAETRVYFAELGAEEDNDEDEQLVIHPPAVHQTIFNDRAGFRTLNALSDLLLEAAEMPQPQSPGDGPAPCLLQASYIQTGDGSGAAVSHSLLLVPLFKNDRLVVGMVLETVGRVENRWSADDRGLLQTVLQRLWLSVQNVRLYRRGQAGAVLEERLRLARNLHDSIQQNLYGIELNISTGLNMLGRENPQIRNLLQIALDYSRNSKTELHSLLFDLRPESLKMQGLVVGLAGQLATIHNSGQMAVTSNLEVEPEVSLETKEALYWISREALHNVVKHSQATHLELSLEQPDSADFIQLTVADNGRGFDTDGVFPGHMGLHSMRERVARLGGDFSIESSLHHGTTVRARFPITD